MKGIRIAFLFMTILLFFPSCADQEKPDSDILFDGEYQLSIEDGAVIQVLDGNILLYRKHDGNTQMFYSYDLGTKEKKEIGKIENFAMSTNPLPFGKNKDRLYFYMSTYEKNSEITNLFEMGLENQSIIPLTQETITGKLSYITNLNEEVLLSLKSNSSNFNTTDVSYVEKYQVDTGFCERIIQKELNANGTRGERIWAITAENKKIYLFVVDYSNNDWKIEVYNESGSMIKQYDCNDSRDFFLSDWVANIEVYGDYVFIASVNDMSIYKMEKDGLKMVAYATNVDSFYGAICLNASGDRVALSSRGSNFFLLDTKNDKLYVTKCKNLDENTEEHIFKLIQDGENIIYSTSDPINKIKKYYYSNTKQLMENSDRTIELSGSVVDLSEEAKYPTPSF
ncbi:MAG: hypothetical protein HFK04_00960 [Oscillospiraceae bacterium]|nr:hypothetical protein [Oscillospiraceae bacterium]